MDSLKTYRLIIEPEAVAGIENAFRWIEDRSPEAAAKWRQGMYEAIRSLSTLPSRCAYAPEATSFDIEIRQLLYGKRAGIYRILFTILEDSSTVDVLHVRHSAQKRITPEDINEDEEG